MPRPGDSENPAPSSSQLAHRLSELEARLEQALAERDEALLDLAKERELTNALRLSARSRDEPEPMPYPPSAGLGEPPLRYRVADAANDTAKGVLGPWHQRFKRLAARLWGGR